MDCWNGTWYNSPQTTTSRGKHAEISPMFHRSQRKDFTPLISRLPPGSITKLLGEGRPLSDPATGSAGQSELDGHSLAFEAGLVGGVHFFDLHGRA